MGLQRDAGLLLSRRYEHEVHGSGPSGRLGGVVGWGAPWNDIFIGFMAEAGVAAGTANGTSRKTISTTYASPYGGAWLMLQIPWRLPVRPPGRPRRALDPEHPRQPAGVDHVRAGRRLAGVVNFVVQAADLEGAVELSKKAPRSRALS